jgi:putative transposase
MMPRIHRIQVPDVPYHVTQRGNARQQVFFETQDYALYLDLLSRASEAAGLRVWAYCLMPNHVHLLVLPTGENSLAQAMCRTHADFARYFNLRNRACGHVWQARYFSTPLDDAHLWQAMAYVERNPVRASLVPHAEEYAWSSARLRRSGAAGLVDLAVWERQYDWHRWKKVLETSIAEEAFGQRLQETSRRGRPLGDPAFVQDLERRCGRKLLPLPVGRPKKVLQKDKKQLAFGKGI